ncbi:hypothetical protein ASF92_05675 [Pedobacter sp. Leaf176]|nr:hypothetical protein ASF92_05675 [Pedobacter sp. Leaf176]
MLAAHYRSAYLKELRFNRLLLNLDSGISLVLFGDDFSGRKLFDLFEENADSVALEKANWGIYDYSLVKSFISGDTLKRAFLIGKSDESELTSVYLSDEDRPLSVSGDTRITGDAVLPKSGVKQSYVEGRPYSGTKLVYGAIKESKRTLPALDEPMLKRLSSGLDKELQGMPWLGREDVSGSFFDSVKVYRLKPGAVIRQSLSGNVALYSDTTLVISAEANLDGIQVYAPFIRVDDGFKGACQLFARDSIVVGKGTTFNYPSCLGVIRTQSSGDEVKISCGDRLDFNGVLFSYEAKRSGLQTTISLGKDTRVNGEIYATGLVKMEKGLKVNGKIACNRFLMQTPQTLYENFLVDVDFNRKARSKYYLSSGIFKENAGKNKILKWLN